MSEWTPHEEAALRSVVELGGNYADALPLLPGRTILACYQYARANGIKKPNKKKERPEKKPKKVLDPIIQEIENRRVEQGFSMIGFSKRAGYNYHQWSLITRGRICSYQCIKDFAGLVGLKLEVRAG